MVDASGRTLEQAQADLLLGRLYGFLIATGQLYRYDRQPALFSCYERPASGVNVCMYDVR